MILILRDWQLSSIRNGHSTCVTSNPCVAINISSDNENHIVPFILESNQIYINSNIQSSTVSNCNKALLSTWPRHLIGLVFLCQKQKWIFKLFYFVIFSSLCMAYRLKCFKISIFRIDYSKMKTDVFPCYFEFPFLCSWNNGGLLAEFLDLLWLNRVKTIFQNTSNDWFWTICPWKIGQSGRMKWKIQETTTKQLWIIFFSRKNI